MIRKSFFVLVALVVFAMVAHAQDVISARAGFVNYKHGQVILPKGPNGSDARQLQPGQTVSTDDGRVEVLLTPGTFLRLDNKSAARMISTNLTDVQVELLSGTATVEADDLSKGASVTILWHGQRIPITHKGLYRFEPGPEAMRVYVDDGKLNLAGQTLKSGRDADLTSSGMLAAVNKFNRKNTDTFDRWNQARAYQLASASQAAVSNLGWWYSGFGSYPFAGPGLWYWDPFGYYTFLPYDGIVYSPFGFPHYSPFVVWNLPPRRFHRGRGHGVMVHPGMPTAPSAAHAPAPRPAPSPGRPPMMTARPPAISAAPAPHAGAGLRAGSHR